MIEKRRLKSCKITISMILTLVLLVSFSIQTYGATSKRAKTSSKTYVYGFNINDFGRWTAKSTLQIKISTIASSKLKITYHDLSGNEKDETYIANKELLV